MQKNDTYQGSGRLQATRNYDSWTCSGWWLVGVVVHPGWSPSRITKGILHQKFFYCLNLIFWIIMGCGIARFGRKGLKTTET